VPLPEDDVSPGHVTGERSCNLHGNRLDRPLPEPLEARKVSIY